MDLDAAMKIENPQARRDAIERELDGGYLLTDVMLAEPSPRVAALELIQGIVIERGRPLHTGMERDERFRFATVDGEPIKVKTGALQKSVPADKLHRMHQRGETVDRFTTYPPVFELGGSRAVLVLAQHGYGLIEPRYRRRHSEGRQEKNSYGQPVYAIDRWRVVEIGSIMASRAADELVAKAGEAEDEAERQALLDRALLIYPDHRSAAALAEPTTKKRSR
jgi:hypothetical protein